MTRGGRSDGPGDPAAFEALALPLLPSLYSFARWLTRDRNEAEDLVQETFARALKGFPRFRETPEAPQASFRSWIFRILKNTFLTSRTGLRAATVPLADDAEPDALATDETPESLLLASADRERVRFAIESLPAPFQEVVVLRDVEGLTYQEIADALALPVGTVMSRLSRGRDAIRRAVRGGAEKRP